jgi:acyl-coenzyme A synthetase/AMP-(fatty) acid ligase
MCWFECEPWPPATASARRDGRAFLGEWFVATRPSRRDGLYRVLGRVDDMLKVAGQWVSPGDVEETIRSVEGVADCGVGMSVPPA